MNIKLKEKCDLAIGNRAVINKTFRFEEGLMKSTGAVALAVEEAKAGEDELKEAKKILKENVSAFSDFRAMLEIPTVVRMVLSKDPEDYIKRAIEVNKKVKKIKSLGGEYRVVASMTLLDKKSDAEIDAYVDKTIETYKRMSKTHPVITGSEDVPFAAALALSDKDVESLVNEADECYSIIKKKMRLSGNIAQSVSHILALYEESSEAKCEKFLNLYNTLKENDVKIGKSYELVTLGSLLNSGVDAQTLAKEIKEVSDYLKSAKGFGNGTIGKKIRNALAIMLVADVYAGERTTSNLSVLNSIIFTITMQYVMIAVVACTVASSNSH